jgi:nucleoid DNA-binding protein
MIVELISKYLESNKRLVVPNLGAFIVKEAGRVVLFSNLIKGDDGVLRSLLVEAGVSELETAAALDRFVFEVNFRLESTGECLLDGFGVLKSGVNGTVSFVYQPAAKGEVLDGNVAPREDNTVAQPKVKVVEKPAEKVVESLPDSEDVQIDVVPRQKPAPRREVEVKRPQQREERRQRPQEDYTKGLRYGKGRKVVTGREGATSRKSSKSDLIMKIAIIAALLAIGALVYGFIMDMRASKYDAPFIDNSEIYEDVPESAEKEVRNPDLDYITPKEN